MNKHKTLPLWAAFPLLLLVIVMPALAQSTEKAADADTLFNCTWSAPAVYPITILDQSMCDSRQHSLQLRRRQYRDHRELL